MIASEGKKEQFHNWLFLYTNLFLHEVGGHILFNFMNQGRGSTPPGIDGWTRGWSNRNEGESGRFLERVFFTGNIEYYRDPTQDRNQVYFLPVIHPP